MSREQVGEDVYPFEYLRISLPRGPIGADIHKESEGYLKTLGLNVDSSTDKVRRVAITMRRQMQEKGLNVESVKALKWALRTTGDCDDESELLLFLLQNLSFEQIKNIRD